MHRNSVGRIVQFKISGRIRHEGPEHQRIVRPCSGTVAVGRPDGPEISGIVHQIGQHETYIRDTVRRQI